MSFWEQVEVFVNESVKFSKQAYEKARDMSSVARLEMDIRSLEGKASKAFAALGGLVYEKISDKKMPAIESTDAEIAEFVQEIQKIEQKIREKRDEVKEIRSETGSEE